MCMGGSSYASLGQNYVQNPSTGATSLNNWSAGWNGTSMGEQNPGSIDLSQTNPALAGIIKNMGGLEGNAGQMVNEAFDPNYYQPLVDKYKANAETSTNNQFARMGLAGSSANAGSVQQADQNVDLGFLQRQQQMQAQALGTAAGLDKNLAGLTLEGQGQYNHFQNSALDSYFALINAQNQQQASNNQMWGSIIGGGIQGGGMAAMAFA